MPCVETDDCAATEARLAARARGEAPTIVLRPGEIEHASALAEAHHRKYPPSKVLGYDAIVVGRQQGRIKEVVTSARNGFAPSSATMSAPILAPRRQATTSPRGRARTARRSGSSRDGPSESSEPPLARPLTAAERRWLKIEVDARRRELIAARPEVTPEDFALFDGDRP